MFLGTGRRRRHTSGRGKGRRGNPKGANDKIMECDACHSPQHIRRERPQGDGRGRGPSMHLAQTDSDTQHVDWEPPLAGPADGSATIVNLMAARYLNASMTLENYSDELFDQVFTGHDDIDLAEWL
eukprot:532830-Pyramimonas_sp.AAC.1